MQPKNMRLAASLALAAAATAPLAHAQDYPAKTIRTIMTVGGAVDVAVRALSEKMARSMGQPVIVEMHSGAGGSEGAGMISRAAPDGYTIGMATTSAMTIRPFVSKNVPYDTLKDFTPITSIAAAVSILAAKGDAPYNNVKELIEHARKNPGKLTFGTSGIGTTHHLSGEMLMLQTGIKMRHVPYKSGGQSTTGLVAGEIDVMFGVLATATAHLGTGRIKLLAINGGHRYKGTGDLPTVNESVPGYRRPAGWMAYFAPARLPQPITRRLHGEIVKGMQQPDVVAIFDKLSLEIDTAESPEVFAREVAQIFKESGEIVRDAGLKPR